MALSIADQLSQLNSARQIVLSDPSLYPQIVAGILPIVGANARLELRRWGAEFLAETFASPVVSAKIKADMGISVLSTVKEVLEMSGEPDTAVVKGMTQTSASIYGFIFKYIIDNPSDIPVWNNMAAIKSNILKRWDTAAMGIKICCIKFVQKVVQIQTPGAPADPRRPNQNEISIAIVPRDHPLIPPPRLEPEASGLLDRLLDVFHQETSDAVLVNATLNCLAILIRTRQSIANKIMTAILNFNPLKRAKSPLTPKEKVQIKSMERTARALLLNMLRRNDSSPVAPRIKQYVDRMAQSRMELFAEAGVSKKRAVPIEPTDGLDNNKRRRLGVDIPPQQGVPLQMNGPKTLAQLFTLSNDREMTSFDVAQIPYDLAFRISLGLIAHIDEAGLNNAINTVRARLLGLKRASQPPALGDDEEDYEPALGPNEDREQILDRADALSLEVAADAKHEIALGPFTLPQPPPLTPKEVGQISKSTIDRIFGMMDSIAEQPATKRRQPGLNRLAGCNYGRDDWVTIITRLATRASGQLYKDREDENPGNGEVVMANDTATDSGDVIRDHLWRYIMEDFRVRMPIAVAWLNEEWFNEKLQQKAYASRKDRANGQALPKHHYDMWTVRILDSIMPYLDAKDQKVLIRFLSEIPVVNEEVIERVKSLARDPERVDLCVKALLYLILMKPPAREMCIDALEDLWRNYDDAKAPAAKVLQKWRPHILTPAPPESEAAVASTPGVKDARSPPPQSAAGTPAKTEEIKSPTVGMPVAAAG